MMRYLMMGLMVASLTLAGCSRKHGWSTEELVIEGGEDPDGGTAYPATIYGSITWYPMTTNAVDIYITDDNGILIGHKTISTAGPGTYSF